MRKQRTYWVWNPRGFNNTYSLYYADGREMEKLLPPEAERITRKQALKLAAEERERKRWGMAFANFADDAVFPAGYDCFEKEIQNDRNYELRNHIWERVAHV